MRTRETVRLYPDPHHYVHGEPATVRDVSPAEAERLLAYRPPAYHTEPPEGGGPSPAAPGQTEAAGAAAGTED